MGKKKFEEKPYDPIRADLSRELAGVKNAPDPSENSSFVVESPLSQEPGTKAVVPPEPSRSHQRNTLAKRFVLTREEDSELSDFLRRIHRKSGTKVSLSVITRACLLIAQHAEDEILAEIEKSSPNPLPSTHDKLSFAEFEQGWVQTIAAAFRRMSPLR